MNSFISSKMAIYLFISKKCGLRVNREGLGANKSASSHYFLRPAIQKSGLPLINHHIPFLINK